MTAESPVDNVGHSLRLGIASFFAAGFLITNANGVQFSAADLGLVRFLALVLAGLMILAGFAILTALLCVPSWWKKGARKLELHVTPILFTTASVQLLRYVYDLYRSGSSVMLWVAVGFCVLVLIVSVQLAVKEHVFQSVSLLLTASVAFNTLAALLVYARADRWQVLPYAVIGIVLVILASARYERDEKAPERQQS